LPEWVEDQARVGRRAETYSLLRERLEHPGQVLYIAAERDDAGYDLEVTGPDWIRYVEVKGSRSTTLAFHLSLRELDEAERRGPEYELQFWGGIDLSKGMAHEYRELVSAGYPRCLSDLKEQIQKGYLHLSPDGFLAKEAADPSYSATSKKSSSTR
jgi:hypothetical protein